ncbi:MAG: HepT-like ribonuclease domain-containing protein [Candidatus Moraniibacteriota bacterium]
MSEDKKDSIRVKHILDAIALLDRHLGGVSEEEFLQNDLLINLAARQIAIIGEAMDSLSSEFRDQHPDLPYRKAKDMRNFLIHEYFDVSDRIVWDTYKADILSLKPTLEEIM